MGIDGAFAKFLLELRRSGVSFGRTLCLGRQRLYLSDDEREDLAHVVGVDVRPEAAPEYAFDALADRFLHEVLGVESLESVDASAYEGATLVHDLNLPNPDELDGAFDVVLDGGTLEHVFNLPVALASCMRMVRQGGSLVLSTPANNQCGHGFYQFSPELFFRVLGAANGFELRHVVLVSHPPNSDTTSRRRRFFQVTDPDELGQRLEPTSRTQLTLLVAATRVAPVTPFAAWPQQSDYARMWLAARSGRAADPPREEPLLSRLRTRSRPLYRALPFPVKCLVRAGAEWVRDLAGLERCPGLEEVELTWTRSTLAPGRSVGTGVRLSGGHAQEAGAVPKEVPDDPGEKGEPPE